MSPQVRAHQLKYRYTWEELRAQFKELARLFVAVEERVWSEGKLNASELNHIAIQYKLSPLGEGFLADMVKQSERLSVVEEGDQVFLVPNPDYVPEEEEEITGIRELIPRAPTDPGNGTEVMRARTTTKKVMS